MEDTILKLRQGMLKGTRETGCRVFLGVPYAEPPVNGLRWHRPAEKTPWNGIRDALEYPPQCPQADLSGLPLYGKEFYDDQTYNPPCSEDCLYLNLFLPEKTDKCPVLVWIHGGSFDHGHCSEKEFDGREYAKRGIIFASVNYRLGVFGFSAFQSLMEQDGTTGNYGLLDQIAAIRFLRENIQELGGDPDNITVMGQSAGAFCTQALWASPLTEGLFRKVILLSGCGEWKGLKLEKTPEEAYEVTRMIERELNTNDLTDMPADQLLSAYMRVSSGRDILYGPVIDGYVLKESVMESFRKGKMKKLPAVLSSTSEDILCEQESKSGFGRVHDAAVQAADLLKENDCPAPYVYHFSRQLPGSDDGAFHSSELWYVFGTLDRCWRPWEAEDYALSRQIIDELAAFIHTGRIPERDVWNGKNVLIWNTGEKR